MAEHAKSEMCPEPIDLTKDVSESNSDVETIITRRKGKPKKFGNLSDIDIEEKRKVANVQERKRMKKLSKALEDLRKCIPVEYHLSNRKMSKIRTLRLAVNYIASLTEIIERDNLLKRQAYYLESQMLQSTYSYLVPSPNFGHSVHNENVPSLEQPGFSPYRTPYSNHDHRLSKRHLNFSPFCGKPSRISYQTPAKQDTTPFRTSEMISRRRTSTITSPLASDIRNINELSASFVSPTSDNDSGISQFQDSKEYTYTLDGISPLSQGGRFYGGTDCVYDPRRTQKE